MKRITPFVILICAGLPWSAFAELRFSGVTQPRYDIRLSVPVSGVVAQRFAEEGDRVEKGDQLLKLDDRLEANDVKRQRLLWENRAQLETTQERLEIIESMLQSSRELYESSGSVSREEVQTLQLRYFDLAGRLQQLKNEEAVQEVEYQTAQTQLQRRRLTSPIEGVVTRVLVSPGEWAQSGKPLIRIVDPRRGYLVVNIAEPVARRLQAGQSLPLEAQGENGTVRKASNVVSVSPVADPASGLVRVKIGFDNQDLAISPGVEANILVPEAPSEAASLESDAGASTSDREQPEQAEIATAAESTRSELTPSETSPSSDIELSETEHGSGQRTAN